MIKQHSDSRFKTIANCKIVDLWRKVPESYGGYRIDISYKKDDNDFFSEHFSIEIDQSKFKDDILNFKNNNRLYYSHGMTDIDIFKQGKEYCIYWSPSDGTYIYFMFPKEEFNKLKSWFKFNK